MTPIDSGVLEKRYEGSSVSPGYTYQNIPSRPEIPYHRGGSDNRARRICELVNVHNKRVLDLGCSVGTMSEIFKDIGAKEVIGVDHDKEAIDIAREIVGDKCTFEKENITIDWLKGQGTFDVIVWTSQFNWMAKQHGLDYALDFLYEVSTKCDVLVFETAGRGDGMAPLDIAQEDVIRLLVKNTCFQEIKDCGPWGDDWTVRNVFVCAEPRVYWKSAFSTVQRIHRKIIRKTYDGDSSRAMELYGREKEFLNLFNNNRYFPSLISAENLDLTMEYSGIPAIWIPDKDLHAILDILRSANVIHRDIRPENILWNGENCVLIDFAYAIRKGEVTNYPYELGAEYKCPHGYNDEYSLRSVQADLLSR